MAEQIKTLHLDMPDDAKQVFAGVAFSVYQWPQQMYDGSTAIFERIKRSPSAGIIAITDQQKFVVSYQEQPRHKPFWGLLGGVVDEGETPDQCVKRELLEEAGMAAHEWREWFAFRPSVRIEWTQHVYVARGVKKVAEPHLDAGEKITLHEFSFEQFLELIQRDDFRDTEVSLEVLKAMVNAEKMAAMRKIFFE